jgi:hypothetical protein
MPRVRKTKLPKSWKPFLGPRGGIERGRATTKDVIGRDPKTPVIAGGTGLVNMEHVTQRHD